jgi:plasmid stabilization system protein ParE
MALRGNGCAFAHCSRPPYRFWPTGPAYIAYRSDVRPVRIVRIARASRDWIRFVPAWDA